MSQSFNFLNVTGEPRRSDPNYKKAVRSSAMRAWRQKERHQRVLEHRTRLTTSSQSSSQSTSPLPSDVEDPLPLLNRSATLSIAHSDPFSSLALTLPPLHQSLLSFFATQIDVLIIPLGGSSYPNSWTHLWLQRAISSPHLLTALCCHAATQRAYASRHAHDLVSLHFRSLAFASVNEALEAEGGCPSDETIAAVIGMTADVFITGEAHELATHLAALNKMVALRGGERELGFDGWLARGLAWHTAPAKILNPGIEGVSLRTRALPAVERGVALERVILQARGLTERLKGERGEVQTIAAQSEFVDERTRLEHALVGLYEGWRAEDGEGEGRGGGGAVSTVVCAALLIYTFRYLRNFTGRAPVVLALARGLREGLEKLEGGEWSREEVESLFWAVNMGLQVESWEIFERVWLSSALEMGIWTVGGVREFLEGSVVWCDDVWTAEMEVKARSFLGEV